MKDLELTITIENNMANLDYNDIIDRMEEACADIEAALIEQGVTPSECDGLPGYADLIRAIKAGGIGKITTVVKHVDTPEEINVTVEEDPSEENAAIMTFYLARGVQGPQGPAGADGKDGAQGASGTSYEFVYALTQNTGRIPLTPPYNSSDRWEGIGSDGVIWSLNPQGVTDDLPIEWMSQRTKEDGIWSAYSTPVEWSRHGKIGKDGNGIEYIFCSTKDETQPTPPNSDPDKNEDDTQWPLTDESGMYSWYDDPQTVTETMPICWVSVRKQQYVGEVQKWGVYSKPAIWSKYSKDGKDGIDGGGRTIFAFTAVKSGVEVLKPIGGGWDPINNIITAPKCNPDQTEQSQWTVNTPNIKEGAVIWMSSASFDSRSTIQGDWSVPIRITGEDGVNGTDGTNIEFIYRLLPHKEDYFRLREFHENSSIKLWSNPSESMMSSAPDKIDRIDSYQWGWIIDEENPDKYTICNTNWTYEPKGIDGSKYLVECACVRTLRDDKWSEWSMPFPWAIWGEDGTDGAGVEYIYRITPKFDNEGRKIEITYNEDTNEYTIPDALKIPTYKDLQEWDEHNHTNYAELFQKDEFVPGSEFGITGFTADWTDEPLDVGPDEPIEWVAIRKKRVHDGETVARWGDFSLPKKWAQWTEDGTTFKTSYVFTVTRLPLNQLLKKGDVKGGNWSTPTPDPTEVIYENRKHLIVWNDTITETDCDIWMTSRTFQWGDDDPDNENSIDLEWSFPIKMSDIDNKFQVEFTKGVLDPETGKITDARPTPTGLNPYQKRLNSKEFTNFDDAEKAWRKDQKELYYTEWSDNMPDAVWMATSSCNNGIWSNWNVVKIKGETGKDGANGTSVTIQGHGIVYRECDFNLNEPYYNQTGSLAIYVLVICEDGYNDQSLYKWDPTNNRYKLIDENVLETGWGYLLDGDLWVWDGDSFENVGQIKGDKGDPGTNMYLYMAFSDDPRVLSDDRDSVTLDLSKVGGYYVGYQTTIEEKDSTHLGKPEYYKWSKWQGEDGWGYEQAFLLTKEAEGITFDQGPTLPSKEPDATWGSLPSIAENIKEISQGSEGKWSDTPLTPTADYPFCWMISRAGNKSNVGDWKGTDNNKAMLYNRYIYDPYHLELSDDNIVVPLEPGESFSIVDSDFNTSITVQLYCGTEKVTENVSYFYETVSGRNDVSNNTIELSDWSKFAKENTSYFQKITFGAEHNGREYIKNVPVRYDLNAYKISTDKTVIRKDSSGNYIDGDNEVTVTVLKWNNESNKYVPETDIVIFAKYDETVLSEELIGDESVTFDFSDHVFKKVRIYISANNNEKGVPLDFEDIGVITDGKDGVTAYHLELSEDNVTVPVDNLGNIDEDFKSFDLVAMLYAGDTVLGEDEGVQYGISFSDTMPTFANESIITVNSSELSNKPKQLWVFAHRPNGTTFKKVCHITYSSIPYEMTVSASVIRNNIIENKLEPEKVSVFVKKWKDNHWENVSDATVYCEYTTLKEELNSTESVSTVDGVAEFNIQSLTEAIEFRFSVKNTKDEEIAFEKVGVVRDGADGSEQEFIYLLSEEKIDDWTGNFSELDSTDANYQVPDFGDGKNNTTTNTSWTDAPTGVSEKYKYEYVSGRKKVDGSWAAFSTPALWARYSKDGEKGDKGEIGGTGPRGENGTGITSITKKYALSNSDSGGDTLLYTSDKPLATDSNQKYCWCEETVAYTNNKNSDQYYYIATVHGEPGATGTGKDAPIIYPAGVYSSTKTYTQDTDDNGNVTKVPYVFCTSESAGEKGYWLLKATSSEGNLPGENSNYWEKIESFDAIYADAGIFNQALVGPAVFYKDYVFSQTATNGTSDNYRDFVVNKDGTINTSGFNPATWFDFKTGAGSLANGNIAWDKDGKVTFGEGASMNWTNVARAVATQITDDAIESNKISAKSVNTTSGNGNIEISENNIFISGEDNTSKVIKISGSDDKYSDAGIKQPINIAYNYANYFSSGHYVSDEASFGNIDCSDTDYVLTSFPEYHISVSNHNTNSGTVQFGTFIILDASNGSDYDSMLQSKLKIDWIAQSYEKDFQSDVYFIAPQTNTLKKLTSATILPKALYKVTVVFLIFSDNLYGDFETHCEGKLTISPKYDPQIINIGKFGFRYVYDTTHYISLLNDKAVIRMGNYGIKFTDEGFYIGSGGKWYPVTPTHLPIDSNNTIDAELWKDANSDS